MLLMQQINDKKNEKCSKTNIKMFGKAKIIADISGNVLYNRIKEHGRYSN